MPRNHRLTKQKAVRLEDFSDEEWLTGVSAGSCRDHLIELCQVAGFDPKISFESDDYNTLQGLVAAGMGVTLLPELAFAGRHTELELRPVAPKPPDPARVGDDPGRGLTSARHRGDARRPG